jgi:hypothetical protein
MKSKAEVIKQRKEESRKEQTDLLRKKAEDAGLTFVEEELPVDHVDESEVRQSNWKAFKSMIPYTHEWYEGRIVEDEMDNLKRIRIENVKAKDLYAMTKLGQHEEALETMMAETNYDFFYFNRLKTKMESEGKFKFQEPNLNPFSFLNKGKDQNRIKKAFHLNHFMVAGNFSDNLGSPSSSGDARQSICSWKGKNSRGDRVQCTNRRMVHPTDISKGLLPHCSYHTPLCVSQRHRTSSTPIESPNMLSLCLECYSSKMMKKHPPKLSAATAPGVLPINIGLAAQKMRAEASEEAAKSGRPKRGEGKE